jgi:parvulin-like peptidyl-prolyl isomerase
MSRQALFLLPVAALWLSVLAAFAQTPPAAPTAATTANAVAATVNGQPVHEATVQRTLSQRRVPPDKRGQARQAFLNFLIDNVLIEQYLRQLQVTVDPKDVDAKLTSVRKEMGLAAKEDWDKWLESMQMTEAELNQEATADMRWHKFAYGVATDEVLRAFFEANKDMFDGTQVRARHILLTPPMNNPQECEQAVKELRQIRQQIEDKVAEGLKKMPANTTPIDHEKARIELLDKAFADAAQEKSKCPSKTEGGDLNFFGRVSGFVEPFAKAAFALKPFEMSDVVQTEFGYHLILVTDRVGTRDVKIEDAGVKNSVLQVFCEKKREEMLKDARSKSRIEIAPVAKP